MNEIQQYFDAMQGKIPATHQKATVKTVDKEGRCCVVQPYSNPESLIQEVQFRSRLGAKDGVIIVPKEGSDVIIAYINNNPADAFIVETSEVEELYIEIGGFKLMIKNNQLYENTADETQKAVLGNVLKNDVTALNGRVNALFALLQNPAFVAAILLSVTDASASYNSLIQTVLQSAPQPPTFNGILSQKINVG
jgi:hypothetical protein